MKIEPDLLASSFRLSRCVVGIGTFDGIHLGHQKLIETVKRGAQAWVTPSVILTFEPHPQSVLSHHPPELLISHKEKLEVLAALKVDYTAVIRFHKGFSTLTPAQFVEKVLQDRLKAQEVVVGFNFTFGAGGVGTPADLMQLGHDRGFKVSVVPAVEHQGQVVSSTQIRRLLSDGQVETAQVLLGRPYSLEGRVVRGEGRGRHLGFPTANLDLTGSNRAIPRRGVYLIDALLPAGETLTALVNIGQNPTFHSQTAPPLKVEAHLPGYQGDLLGQELTIRFRKRIRDEKKFESVDALIAQIQDDLKWTRPGASGHPEVSRGAGS